MALYGYATDVVPDDYTLSPRAGFNWDLSGGGSARQQVRGSIGYFGGRTPYVWLSNQYGNTGIEFRRLAVRLQHRQSGCLRARSGQPAHQRRRRGLE